MDKLVLISHGDFAKELKKSVELIMGSQENIYTVELIMDDGPDSFKGKLEGVLDKCVGSKVVVFSDLMGGTPCNIASNILMEKEYSFELYSGMNMPMVINYVNGQISGFETDPVEDAKHGVKHINKILYTL